MPTRPRSLASRSGNSRAAARERRLIPTAEVDPEGNSQPWPLPAEIGREQTGGKRQPKEEKGSFHERTILGSNRPLRPFKIDPMNEREAGESGLRLKAQVAP